MNMRSFFKQYFDEILLLLLMVFFISSGMMFKQQIVFFLLIVLMGLFVFLKGMYTLTSEQRIFTYILLAFFLTVFLSALASGDMLVIFEYPFEVFKFLLFVPFIAIAIAGARFNEQQFYKVFLLAASYTLCLSVYIIYYNIPRSTGVLESPIILGNLGVLFGVTSLVIAFSVKGKYWKFLAIILFLSGILVSFLSASRGGWLAILFALVTVYSFVKIDGSFKKGYAALLFLVSLFFILYILWDFLPIQHRVEQAFFGIQEYLNGNHETSVGYRFEMWKAGWYGFLEKPILGWGFTNFNEVFKKYLELGLVKSQGDFIWRHPHNDFIQILVELGSLGFIIFMSVFIYPLVYFFRNAFKASRENIQVLYLSLIGIVLIEAILEFMLTNRGVTIIYIFHLYIVVIYVLFTLINRIKRNEVRDV